MKKLFALAIAALVLSGCGRIDGVVNSWKSYSGLLERTVTLYDANGKVIKSWVTDNEITYQGPVAGFVAKDGTNVRVAGTIVIEGK
jgi:hypothetical protein